MELQVTSAQSFIYLWVDVFFSPYTDLTLIHNHTFRPGILPWVEEVVANLVMQPPS